MRRAAEFGKAFGKVGEEALNMVNPADPVNIAGGVIVGKVARISKGFVEKALEETSQKLLGEQAAKEGVEAVVSRFWTRTEINGLKMYQRNDLIDPGLVDSLGRTNLQRMELGRAPLGSDGGPINLHHMLQSADSPLAEVTQTFHQSYSGILHINPSSMGSGIDQPSFDRFRAYYWMQRAKDFQK